MLHSSIFNLRFQGLRQGDSSTKTCWTFPMSLSSEPIFTNRRTTISLPTRSTSPTSLHPPKTHRHNTSANGCSNAIYRQKENSSTSLPSCFATKTSCRPCSIPSPLTKSLPSDSSSMSPWVIPSCKPLSAAISWRYSTSSCMAVRRTERMGQPSGDTHKWQPC